MNRTQLVGVAVLGAGLLLLLTGLSGFAPSTGLTGRLVGTTEQAPLDYEVECRRTTDSAGTDGPADHLTLQLEAEVTNTDTAAGTFTVTFTVDEHRGDTITRTENLELASGETKTATADITVPSNYAYTDCSVDPGTKTVTR